MEKKKYVKPSTENYRLLPESLMITASPGVSDDEFDPANDDRRLVASLKFACGQPEGSWRKISQARGVKTKKRFYIWSTSGWGSGERGRKRDAWRRKNLLPTRHAFAEKQYLCIS